MNLIENTRNIFRTPDDKFYPALTDAATARPKTTSLKSWINLGDRLATLQVTFNADGDAVRAWAPGTRTVDELRATFFTLDGSRCDFSGTRTLHATADYWIGYYTNGDETTVVVYVRTI